MEVDSVFVTGANRGLGLEFVRQLAELPQPPRFIFATYRNKNAAQELEQLRDETKGTEIVLIQMDVTKPEDLEAARKTVEEKVGDDGLTLLINNAGAMKMEPFPNVSEEDLLFHFKTNTIGPIMVIQEFLPLLQKAADNPSKKDSGMTVSRAAVFNISSLAGCITRAGVNAVIKLPIMSYRISKAALNMAMRDVSAHLKENGILVVMMCPGWVKTDLGGVDVAETEIKDSISSMMKTLQTLNDSHHGLFLSRYGDTYDF